MTLPASVTPTCATMRDGKSEQSLLHRSGWLALVEGGGVDAEGGALRVEGCGGLLPVFDGTGEEAGGTGLSAEVAVVVVEAGVPWGELDAPYLAVGAGDDLTGAPEQPVVGFAFLGSAYVACDFFGDQVAPPV